jgi:hypothetical protein
VLGIVKRDWGIKGKDKINKREIYLI